VFLVGIGLRDPRSQKRDLGHPSISPFDIAEGSSFLIAASRVTDGWVAGIPGSKQRVAGSAS
jgi:hypothetical protein